MPLCHIIVVDDHEIVRKGVVNLLSKRPILNILGSASNGIEAIDLCQEVRPDVVIMDVNMPIMNGIEATCHILNTFPEMKILALSGFLDVKYARDMLRAGAVGYVSKDIPLSELVVAISTVFSGQIYLDENLKQLLFKEYIELIKNKHVPNINNFTRKEEEIYNLSKEGLSNKEIAYKIGISVSTVWSHQASIKRKISLQHSK